MNFIKEKDLTKEILIALWKDRKRIFDDEKNQKLVARFNRINETIDWILQQEVVINGNRVIIKNSQDSKEISFDNLKLDYFGVANQELTGNRNDGQEGVLIMAKHFNDPDTDISKRVRDIGCILGGFDFVDDDKVSRLRMVAEYRIVSNTITSKNDNRDCFVGTQNQHPSSHFADNNYFFRVISTINEMKKNVFDVNKSFITLRWVDPGERTSNKEEAFRNILKYRFPYKFFHIWAHKDEVIHPFSLMAYRNFITQKDGDLQYTEDQRMDQDYDLFKIKWKDYSDRIVKIITDATSGDPQDKVEIISELSKLISIIMVNDQDIKNIRDLLETGNKAVILWGPPGTGKTYQAKELVKEMLEISDESEMKKCRFKFPDSNGRSKFSLGQEKGCFDIVQFHPNYTYEDFIGGISPKLEGSTLNYILKEGQFKSFCDFAKNNENKKCIFIIDEINRADLSAVFGELLYALEYRDEPISIPNFGTFVIPPNVYIIGTMNNVDKSLVSFDLALRRRFGFFKVMPNLNVLEDLLSNLIKEEKLSEYIKRCEILNKKISSSAELGLGEDYQIGHAYFLKIKDFLPKEKKTDDEPEPVNLTSFELEKLWAYHIEPLLEEYLGNKIDDAGIKQKIDSYKEMFTKEI